MTVKVDYLITGGTVVDGTGAPPRTGNVGVKDSLIVYCGDHEPQAESVLDATGCVVSPGFIDVHSNLSWGLFVDPTCRISSFQGVTTAITGNCGGSVFPVKGEAVGWVQKAGGDYGVNPSWQGVGDFAERVGHVGVDVLPMVGHGTVRAAIAGFRNMPLQAAEVRRLQNLIGDALQDGAWGVSFGLAYAPGIFADHEELVASCCKAAELQRPCCFHIRIESDRLEEAVAEVIQLAEATRARCVICHHKALGRANWGKVKRTLKMISDANERGCDLYLDLYPYTTALRNLASLLPDWVHEGGRQRLVEKLSDPQLRHEILAGLRENVRRWDASWEDTIIWEAPANPEYHGCRASKIVNERGEEGLLEILLQNEGRVITLYEGASSHDLREVARYGRTAIGSDGNAQHSGEAGHPRSFATFPRFLAEFVVNNKVLPLEEAIWKISGLPARIFGLTDRGLIRPWLRADLCVFPLSSVEKAAGSEHALAVPVPKHLLLAGQVIIESGKQTGRRPARVVLAQR
jgi:N-acyl-D-amino-acid deacylase